MDVEDDKDPKGKGKARAPSAQATALAQALRWVQDVLDLKDKFDAVLDIAFNGDKQVQASINEVCTRNDIRPKLTRAGFPVFHQCQQPLA
jgi:cullin 3